MGLLRGSLLCLGVAGALVFGVAFIVSLAAPGWVEHAGRELVRQQVEKRVGQKIDALDERLLTVLARRLGDEQARRAARALQQLREGLPARVAAVAAEMRQLDCVCRRQIERRAEDGLLRDIVDAQRLQARMTALIRAQYMDTAAQLLREWRIFTGSNALAFALFAASVVVRRRAGWHLLPAAAVLLLAAGATGYGYLFHQNWLHTVVFGQYVGWMYLAYLGLVFALLSDLLLNRARVTGQLLSSMNVSVSPC